MQNQQSELNLNHPSLLKLAKKFTPVGLCYAQNQYSIYSKETTEQSQSKPEFQCDEISTCSQRMCCSGDCREFKLAISDCQEGHDISKSIFLEFVKPYKFTCFGVNRPEMDIFFTQNSQQIKVGKLVIPFSCCYNSISFEVYDQNNKKKFTFKESFCSNLLLCGSCICSEKCKQGGIQIFDENQQEILLNIRYTQSCIAQTNSEFTFPHSYSINDRVLLLAAVFMFDMCFIEQDSRRRGQSRHNN